MVNSSPYMTESRRVKEKIKEAHDKIIDDKDKSIKWPAIKYKLDELFHDLPVFDIPPMHFSELSEEQLNTYEYRVWAELYEIILADTRFSNQSLDYL
jgi:hypothetical protein